MDNSIKDKKENIKSIIHSVSYFKGQTLVTNEDYVFGIPHLHKILGIYCLCHYIYRFYLSVNYQFTMKEDPWQSGFNNSIESLLSVWVHAFLSFSSLIFHVLKRQTVKPMIWDEFRGHNILFAMRSILCFTVTWLAYNLEYFEKIQKLLKVSIILLTMKGADIITDKLRDTNIQTTTRTLKYWDNVSDSQQKSFKFYYMLAQYQATISCLSQYYFFPSFSVMFPIQISSFLLTLCRKGYIGTSQYHILYTISLMIPLFITLNNDCLFPHLSAIMLTLLKRNFNINKFVLWVPYLLMYIIYA